MLKFLKISDALKWVKMSNFWFLIAKIMFYIHEHLYKYSKKHLCHVMKCHVTHRFSISRGVPTTFFWSFMVVWSSAKVGCVFDASFDGHLFRVRHGTVKRRQPSRKRTPLYNDVQKLDHETKRFCQLHW